MTHENDHACVLPTLNMLVCLPQHYDLSDRQKATDSDRQRQKRVTEYDRKRQNAGKRNYSSISPKRLDKFLFWMRFGFSINIKVVNVDSV